MELREKGRLGYGKAWGAEEMGGGKRGRVKIGGAGRESVWKVNLKTQGISIGKTKSED